MIDKRVSSALEAVGRVADGATVLIGGFGESGSPTELVHALIDQGARELVVVNNNAGNGEIGLGLLIKEKRVRKMVCSFPRTAHGFVFAELFRKGEIELEVVPQGTLAERIRAGGSGVAAFFTPTAAHSEISAGKEIRSFNGRPHVLEAAIVGDLALVKAETADRWGNLAYHLSARNFGPIMAMAAKHTAVQVRRFVDLGAIDPEHIVTPGIFVSAVVAVPEPLSEREHLEQLDRSRA